MTFCDRPRHVLFIYSMNAMMVPLLFAFLACVNVCIVQNVNYRLAECFVRDSLGDMSLSVQEYVL